MNTIQKLAGLVKQREQQYDTIEANLKILTAHYLGGHDNDPGALALAVKNLHDAVHFDQNAERDELLILDKMAEKMGVHAVAIKSTSTADRLHIIVTVAMGDDHMANHTYEFKPSFIGEYEVSRKNKEPNYAEDLSNDHSAALRDALLYNQD
ncbi:hypothetical protein Phage2-1_00114 [Achromobacter phage 2-1]|nr:hypothetical protein Phage2-1_00114 [Achromobacter phage 2-1]